MQAYSAPKRADAEYALPDVEVWRVLVLRLVWRCCLRYIVRVVERVTGSTWPQWPLCVQRVLMRVAQP